MKKRENQIHRNHIHVIIYTQVERDRARGNRKAHDVYQIELEWPTHIDIFMQRFQHFFVILSIALQLLLLAHFASFACLLVITVTVTAGFALLWFPHSVVYFFWLLSHEFLDVFQVFFFPSLCVLFFLVPVLREISLLWHQQMDSLMLICPVQYQINFLDCFSPDSSTSMW